MHCQSNVKPNDIYYDSYHTNQGNGAGQWSDCSAWNWTNWQADQLAIIYHNCAHQNTDQGYPNEDESCDICDEDDSYDMCDNNSIA